ALAGRRQQAAQALSSAAARELADLRMSEARFCVTVSSEERDGVPEDHVDFRLATSAEEEPRPMARIASGGELARIALALKTTLAQAETRPTLIFDEIDMGVGGR